MVLVLKKGAGEKEIKAIEEKLQTATTGGFDANKYNGSVSIKGDGLEIQKMLRDEWERDIS